MRLPPKPHARPQTRAARREPPRGPGWGEWTSPRLPALHLGSDPRSPPGPAWLPGQRAAARPLMCPTLALAPPATRSQGHSAMLPQQACSSPQQTLLEVPPQQTLPEVPPQQALPGAPPQPAHRWRHRRWRWRSPRPETTRCPPHPCAAMPTRQPPPAPGPVSASPASPGCTAACPAPGRRHPREPASVVHPTRWKPWADAASTRRRARAPRRCPAWPRAGAWRWPQGRWHRHACAQTQPRPPRALLAAHAQ